jgi:hypothetical protein
MKTSDYLFEQAEKMKRAEHQEEWNEYINKIVDYIKPLIGKTLIVFPSSSYSLRYVVFKLTGYSIEKEKNEKMLYGYNQFVKLNSSPYLVGEFSNKNNKRYSTTGFKYETDEINLLFKKPKSLGFTQIIIENRNISDAYIAEKELLIGKGYNAEKPFDVSSALHEFRHNCYIAPNGFWEDVLEIANDNLKKTVALYDKYEEKFNNLEKLNYNI